MAYQKVTKTSYGGRLKNALGGVAMGFIMLIAGTILLFWNEGRTVKTTRMLKEANKACVELEDIASVNPDMNGKMIHASGLATTGDILTDGQFGVTVNAIKLIRGVEYYQWVEHQSTQTKDKVGGGQETVTTYTYTKEWVGSPQNSSYFEDPDYKGIDNDVLLNIQDEIWTARNVTFGAYKFPEGLIAQMNRCEPFTVSLEPEVVDQYEADFHKLAGAEKNDSYVHQDGNVLYLGTNPNNPSVGDVRVTYEKVVPGDVSILAVVNGDTFERYTAKNGYTLMSLVDGVVGMEGMFEGEHQSNKAISWLLRILGVLLIYFGFRGIFDIITALLKVLPFLGNIASLGVGLVAGVLALAWSLVVIAIGWIVYRPVLGVILLIVAAALIWFLAKKSKEKKALVDN